MKYPIIAPITEHILQIEPYIRAFFLFPKAKGNKRTSGAIGKNEDSETEIIPKIFHPEGLSAHVKTQSYILRIKFILFSVKNTYR
jgi:hypothetical protein